MSAVPGELQLRGGASVSLPTCLPASQPFTRADGGNPAQGQHAHPGPVSGQPGTLPTAHTPLTGRLDVSTSVSQLLKRISGILQVVSTCVVIGACTVLYPRVSCCSDQCLSTQGRGKAGISYYTIREG